MRMFGQAMMRVPLTLALLSLLLNLGCEDDSTEHSRRSDEAGQELAGSTAGTEDQGMEGIGGRDRDPLEMGVEMNAGVEMSAGVESPLTSCRPEWAGLNESPLLEELYRAVSMEYIPIIPEVDLGGTLNRYTTARAIMFTQIDRRMGPSAALGVYTIYTGRFYEVSEGEEPPHDEVNCEHTWPRSRLNQDDDTLYEHQQSDLHHLSPSSAQVNSARGSLPFGEPMYNIQRDLSPALRGQDEEGREVFEPRDEVKGDVARVIFYMAVRWGLSLADYERLTLARWHMEDPVDIWEVTRNDRVALAQGNRNPFIDCPSLIDHLSTFSETIHSERLPLP